MGNFFGRSHSDPNGNDDLVRWRDMQDEEGGKLASKLREIMGDKIQPLVDSDDSGTWLSVLRSGQCRYINAVNLHLLPQPWEDLHRYVGYENTTFPVKTKIHLNLPAVPQPVVYDVFNGKLASLYKENNGWSTEADMSIFPGAILAILPRTIENVQLNTGLAIDRSAIRMVAKIVDSKGNLIDGAIPLHIKLANANGDIRYDLYRIARGGQCDQELPLSANDFAGLWTITVQELFGGHQSVGKINIILPTLPVMASDTAPKVEWTRITEAVTALKTAKTIALLVAKNQQDTFKPVIDAAIQSLSLPDRKIIQVSAEDYLNERVTDGWDKFKVGDYAPAIKLHPKQYDLIVTFATAALLSKVVPADLCAIKPSAIDPGPGRALVQFVAMPVFDNEDGLAIQAGDVDGLVLAADSLRLPPVISTAEAVKPVAVKPLPGQSSIASVPGIHQFVGIPIGQVSATPDGQRIAVAMKGWGNNLFVLSADGKVINGDLSGKYFPLDVVAVPDGFWLTSYENDATCAYWKHYDRDGKPTLRLAADGQRFGGARDWSANHPIVERERFRPQASFSTTRDGHFAAVGGSRGIAVWDLIQQKVIWRDDTVHHTVPLSQKGNVTPDASMFPQVKLSPDGSMMVLQHGGKVLLRDGKTGVSKGEQSLPQGASLGRTRVFNGSRLVVGDQEFFAYRDGKPLWHWKAPTDVNAVAFADDGLHFAIGEPNGTIRILNGSGQIGGYVAPVGGVDSLDMLPDASKVAFSTSGGQVGVLDINGKVLWQINVVSRSQISFLGAAGETVVGDWRGMVYRFNAAGQQLWTVDLTQRVYRDDAEKVLTTPDATPTLRVPAPMIKPASELDAARKLAIQGITYLSTSGWRGPVQITQRESALIDGKKEGLKLSWFTSGYGSFTDKTCRDGAYWLAGAPAAPAFDIKLAQASSVNAVAIYEDTAHPEAIPQEIKIEAWVDGNWTTVCHDLWVDSSTHIHNFPPITTDKLRYTVMGDLYKNLWTTEIEVYKTP